MNQVTAAERKTPAATQKGSTGGASTSDVDPEVLAFRSQFEARSPLDELVRGGAQRMLQAAINAEVDEFLAQHAERRDEAGHRLVVGNVQQLRTLRVVAVAAATRKGVMQMFVPVHHRA